MLVNFVRLLSCGTVVHKGSSGLGLRELWSPLLGPGFAVKTYRAVCGERDWVWCPSILFECSFSQEAQSLISSFLNASPKAVVASRTFRGKQVGCSSRPVSVSPAPSHYLRLTGGSLFLSQKNMLTCKIAVNNIVMILERTTNDNDRDYIME